MVTYICGSKIKYSEFPEEFWKDVEQLMADGDEILLGDSDFDHRVYGRCMNKQYGNVSVVKESSKRSRQQSYLELSLPSFMNMAAKCDRMTAVWDGGSREVFAGILLVLSLHKKCRLYHLPSGNCTEIDSLEAFEKYVPERQGWTDEDTADVFKECGFEEPMTAYTLEHGSLNEMQIAEIIRKAPVPLSQKRELLEKLLNKNNLNHEAFKKITEHPQKDINPELVRQVVIDTFGGSSGAYVSDSLALVTDAELHLKNGMYYLFMEWYDAELQLVKSVPDGMFNSFKKVTEHFKNIKEHYAEDDGKVWYRLEVWDQMYGEWGADPEHKYNFYIYNGEICWFEEMHSERQKDGILHHSVCNNDFFDGGKDLSLPTPYKAGDIVYVDCRPFGPPFHALVTEGRHQNDCCMPQVLYRVPCTDTWELSALKHKMFYRNLEMYCYSPALSPLYRLRAVREDELTKDDELLVKIGSELNGDEDKGYEFGKACNRYRGSMSTEEVVRAWESIVKNGD